MPTYQIVRDEELCVGCGLCEAFCPVDVFEECAKGEMPPIVNPEACWGCETCSGQCPKGALTVTCVGGEDPFESREKAQPLDSDRRAELVQWAETLKSILELENEPVAVTLVRAGAPLPDVPLPKERLRFCQALMRARKGDSYLMPANRHSCPDGTSILGLTDVPAKLASGELYILFHKLDNIEAARQMVAERPHLEPHSMDATLVTPLSKPVAEPDVIVVVATPEQVMWLNMATSYYTGHRHDFKASGYNAQCVEATLIPYITQRTNISFGCYGCRAANDVGPEMMSLGIPPALMPDILKGLRELGKKAIPQSRAKIYLHEGAEQL